MKKRIFLLILSLLLIGTAAFLTYQEWGRYQASDRLLPAGSVIGDIPVGGISQQEAGLRLAQAYLMTPVQAECQGTVIDIDPQQAGLQIDLNAMLSQADEAGPLPFFDFLQNRRLAPVTVQLAASVDEAQLRAYLAANIAPVYQRDPIPARPIIGDSQFTPSHPGTTFDLDAAVRDVSAALVSLNHRTVTFTTHPLAASPPDFQMLEPMLSGLIQVSGYEGLIELYVQDLKTGQEINLAYQQGRPIPPGIAFTGASTIKIPVMVAAFQHTESLSATIQKQMELMIDLSNNDSTDEVMRQTMDENLAPLMVSEDMSALGLTNTFLAGMFYPGAPLLQRFDTPANSRADLTTDPDPYNQTTPAEMGRLLAMIEQCAQQGSGPLISVFKGQVTQLECQQMIDMLKKNRKGVLIESGLPEGTPIAHKYGWVTDPADGLMHNISDAAAVYTPGGNFVFTVYLYDADQLLWDPAQVLVGRLAVALDQYSRLTDPSANP